MGDCVVEDDSEWESMRSEEEFLEDQAEELGIPQPETTQHATLELSMPSECNAQGSLHVLVSQPVVDDTDYQNLCKYTVEYTNTGDQKIWVFVHKTLKNPDTEIKEVWKNYYSLDPGETLQMGYRTVFYKESGEARIEVVTDVAPIFASEGCKNTFRDSIEPRSQISYPIFVPCD
jgi:hypothetical protein